MLRVCLVLLALLPLAGARAADGALVEVRHWTITLAATHCWAFNRPVAELNWQPMQALFWSMPRQGQARLTVYFWPGAGVGGAKQLDVALPSGKTLQLPVRSSSIESLIVDPVPDDFVQALRAIDRPATPAPEGMMMGVSAGTGGDATAPAAMKFDVQDMPEVWRKITACLDGLR
jgi:hypothetical protein